MAIKRYYAKKDNTITNAFKENLETRGTGSNMGASDILEVFSNTVEQARVLIKFPVNETDLDSSIRTIKQDRDANILPDSGSVKFKLKMFNVVHPSIVPRDYKIVAHPLTADWDEGYGVDLDEYSDKDQSNWLSASSTAAWSTAGGDFNDSYYLNSSLLKAQKI